jgi:hypothetical protein
MLKEEGRTKKEEGRGKIFPILPLSHYPTIPLSSSSTLPPSPLWLTVALKC